jgi:hypothetical protein
MEGGSVGHKFERDPPKDHPCQVWFNLANLAGMVLGWSPFNIVSDSPALHSKWLLLLKIEIYLVELNLEQEKNQQIRSFSIKGHNFGTIKGIITKF